MPKLKIKNWKGLYTNIDENDSALDISRTSINFRYNRGYVQFENRELGEYALPVIDTAFGIGWEWETGIYATLTNDPLDQDATATKYDCLILVAKQDDGSQYNRLIFLKDLTNDSIWYELSKEGNASTYINKFGVPDKFIGIENHDGAGGFTNSYFSTTKEGKAYFREEAGHIKLFLPHDCFWIGRIERALRTPYANYDFSDDPNILGWYIDKLVENFDPLMTVSTADIYPPLPHRIAWRGGVSVSTDNVTRNKEINLGSMDTHAPVNIEDGHSERTTIYSWTPIFKDGGGPVPTTVVPYAESLYSTLQNSIFFYDSHVDYGAPAGLVAMPANFADYYETYNPSTGVTIPFTDFATLQNNVTIEVLGSSTAYTLSGRNAWVMPLSAVSAHSWRYVGTVDTTTQGFDDGEERFHMIITAVLDEREEVIVKALTQEIPDTITGKWKIVITNAILLPKSNYRVTRLRYYVKTGFGTVYHLYKDIEFLDTSTTDTTTERATFDIIEADNTAILLAQNIGLEPDEERWDSYKVIQGFRDFTTESGVSIGISNEDYSNIYYSVLGGGNLQPDLMYKQNILQVAGANIINAVAVINKELAALTDDTTYVIKVIESIGALVFTINTTLEFGVKDQFDTAQMQGGLAINTRHGIYTTTGMQSNLISDAIDDIVKANFSSSRIYYNKDLHELYYKISNTDDLYRFRFKDNVWELISKI